MSRVLIGCGPSAMLAAAALEDTLWLDTNPRACAHPELPVDLGGFEDHDSADVVGTLAGAAPEWPHQASILVRGRRLLLPFRRRDLPLMVEPREGSRALKDWVSARMSIKAREVVGGGFEQRSIRDWVVYRYGQAVYEQLYGGYLTRRFGPPEQVAIATAQHHNGRKAGTWHKLGQSPQAAFDSLSARIQRQEGDLEGIEIADGRVCTVHSEDGELSVDRVFWAGSIPELAEWLEGEIPEILATDMQRLSCRHRVEVFLPMSGAEALPEVLHVLDDAPFFRVMPVDMGAGRLDGVACHIAVEPGDALWSAGDSRLVEDCAEALRTLELGNAETEGAKLRRIEHFDPRWEPGAWFPTFNRVAQALEAMGISLVGRSAAYRWMDPGQTLVHARELGRDPSQWHEALRVLVDPPIRQEDEGTPLTDFIRR
ncbi:MAG: hypothetical protein VX899_21180 [Myxococcota bacterium]|nr:hypothetical protein [Myxococcota bacterium]